MSSKLWRIIAVTMASAVIVCAGTGCGKKGENQQDSNTTQSSETISTVSSEEKSSAVSEEASTAVSSASSVDSTEVSLQTSLEEADSSTEESAEESVEASAEEPSEEDSAEEPSEMLPTLTSADVIGQWESQSETASMGFTLLENGEAEIQGDEITGSVSGTWEIADGQVKLTVSGEVTVLNPEDGRLVDAEDSSLAFTRKSATDEEQTPLLTPADVQGRWQFQEGDIYMGVNMLEDGTARIEASEFEGFLMGSWVLDGNRVKLMIDDGESVFILRNDQLVEAETGRSFSRT